MAPARGSRLTEADRTMWANYASQITPLPGRTPPIPAANIEPAAVLPPRPKPIAPTRAAHNPPAALAIGDHPGGVDGASWRRLRNGKLRAGRVLDLHGLTAQRAFHSLVAFLRTAHADRLRCVEVVTGRGSGEGGGVIRRELPHWLNLPDVRPLVLAASYPHAANPGSVRLLLRRIR